MQMAGTGTVTSLDSVLYRFLVRWDRPSFYHNFGSVYHNLWSFFLKYSALHSGYPGTKLLLHFKKSTPRVFGRLIFFLIKFLWGVVIRGVTPWYVQAATVRGGSSYEYCGQQKKCDFNFWRRGQRLRPICFSSAFSGLGLLPHRLSRLGGKSLALVFRLWKTMILKKTTKQIVPRQGHTCCILSESSRTKKLLKMCEQGEYHSTSKEFL